MLAHLELGEMQELMMVVNISLLIYWKIGYRISGFDWLESK